MSFNIMDAVKGQLSPDLLSKASSFLGENESSVSKAIAGILPTVLSGMVSKATSGNSGAADILNVAKNAHSSGMLGGIGNMFGDGGGMLGKGLDIVKGLFGDKFGGIVNTLSSFAGVKSSSISSLLSLAAPIAAGTIGKHATEKNLDASGLASLLNSQKGSIMSMLPAGLSSISSLLGMGKVSDGVSSVAGNAKQTVASVANSTEETAKKGMGLLTWLLPLVIAGGLAWWFLLGGNKMMGGTDTAPVNSDTINAVTPVDAASTVFKVKLPDGTELVNANKGGIEDKLVAFLSTDWSKLGEDSLKKLWFDFDNLNFKTGKAEITPESMQQVSNMIAILKAYPAAKLKIGGYTDKVGNEEGNKKLSTARSIAVKTALEAAGVGAQVLSAEGYGSQFAKFPATASEADRVKDRHVSVSIRP
jgi:outer membrane protein OmpA-like peptidoglycan-associated protein